MSKMIMFLREVKTELERITWPKWEDLTGAIIVVCILSVAFAAIIGLMDSGISKFIHWMIR